MFTVVIHFIENLFAFGNRSAAPDIDNCSVLWNHPNRRIWDASAREIVTLSTVCEKPADFEYSEGEHESKMIWNVETNGFHTAVNMKFSLEERWRPAKCRWSMYIPETSFVDIGSAEDRELMAPQNPKLHFAPMSTTFIEIQHRYQPVGAAGNISIMPPVVFCMEYGKWEKVDMERPAPITVSVPVYDGSHIRVVSMVVKALPIVALVIHGVYMIRNRA